MGEDDLIQTTNLLGCKAEKLLIIYLGFPFEGYPREKMFWQPVIDQIHKKLDRWKIYNISRGGRHPLCKSVLVSLPTYYLSLFSIPKNVAASIERIIQNFFWESHAGSKINHLVKWNKASAPLKDGGFGLGGIKNHNTTLLAKCGWRFSKEESALWRQMIRSIHRKEPFDWFTKGQSGNSLRSSWVSIARVGGRLTH